MKTVAPALKLSGLDRFITEDASAAWREGGVEPEKAAFSCALRFEKLDDFRPECLVKNVETLAAFFERRNLLQDLAAKLDGNDALQASLQKMLFPTGDSVSELDALRKAYKEALASVDAARDAVSKAGEDQEKQRPLKKAFSKPKRRRQRPKKLDEHGRRKPSPSPPRWSAIPETPMRISASEVAMRVWRRALPNEDNPFTLPASGSMLGMLTERVACKDKLLACQLDAILRTSIPGA
ncbi:MAG: type VI secretion system contractile sheath small subunit [Bilophila wadsworthia]